MLNFKDYNADELGGIPFEWWHQIDKACDLFFMRRGMRIKGPSLKEIMHQEAQTRQQEKTHKC